MAQKQNKKSVQRMRRKLEEMGFDLVEIDGEKLLARKNGCAAMLQPAEGDASPVLRITVPPGRVVRGELARLVDRGYQKFLKTADAEVPAMPEDLRAISKFQQELRYVLGLPTLYNQALGSVSDRYLYDRVWFRDQGRQPEPWQQPKER